MRLVPVLLSCSIALAGPPNRNEIIDTLKVPQSGREADENASQISLYPSVASLQYEENNGFRHACGGSILSPTHVLTAAQCEPPETLFELFRVRVGSADSQSGGQVRNVGDFYPHPDFSRTSLDYDYDIAVITVTEPIRFNLLTQPIRLATGPEPSPTSYVSVVGWTFEDEYRENLLGYESLPVQSKHECTTDLNSLSERQICIGGTWSNERACGSHIGGPAFQNGFQYGIVSSSFSCKAGNKPEIYSSIVYLYRWVIEATNR